MIGARFPLLPVLGLISITRLRLRAEFMDDDEQRRKMLSDLDEMEQMITATLTSSSTTRKAAVTAAAYSLTVRSESGSLSRCANTGIKPFSM